MSIAGVQAEKYPQNYAQTAAKRNEDIGLFGRQVQEACGRNQSLTLHIGDDGEGGRAIGAWGNVATDTSVTVYKPRDFDEEHPVYRVKIWDRAGNVTEQMIDISEVDPADCNEIEMYAYTCHLSDSGAYPDAMMNFMMGTAEHNSGNHCAADLFVRTNWLSVIQDSMEMQKRLGNYNGYLQYKWFLEFLSEK